MQKSVQVRTPLYAAAYWQQAADEFKNIRVLAFAGMVTALAMNTLRALEEGLDDFAGCAVVISHDRWFLDRICTHILAFEGNSEVFFFEGSYSEYEENKMKRLGNEEPKRVRYRKLMED